MIMKVKLTFITMRRTVKTLAILSLVLILAAAAEAQSPARPIQDNSFLMEEAYNQEAGVVQHISFFNRLSNGEWAYTFTQEWPIGGLRHQLSYTIPIEHTPGNPPSTGIGDVLLNYRYQLVGSGETRLAVAPRLSVLLPTGSTSKGFGAGAAGVQVNLPLSWMLTPHVATHWNAGVTIQPTIKVPGGIDGS